MSDLSGKLIQIDRQLFQYLNSCHLDFLDQPFFWISSDSFWIPLYFFLIFLIIKKLKRKSIEAIACIALSVALSDQGANLLKRTTKRPRPTYDPVLSMTVHTVHGYQGGKYGFVSSHAANTFCAALWVTYLLSPSLFFSCLLFFWATIVSYSRIYLGVHFPLDVLCGALLGLFIAALGTFFWKWREKHWDQKGPFPK